MRKFILAAFVMATAGLVAGQSFKTLEDAGVQMMYSAKTSAASSHTATGYLAGWSVLSVGGTADFVVKHSTYAGGSVDVNISSTIYATDGVSVTESALGRVVNPMIVITRLDAATTVYIDIGYLKARAPGNY